MLLQSWSSGHSPETERQEDLPKFGCSVSVVQCLLPQGVNHCVHVYHLYEISQQVTVDYRLASSHGPVSGHGICCV